MNTNFSYYINTSRKCLCKPNTTTPVVSKNDLPELNFGDEPIFTFTFPDDVLTAGDYIILAIDDDFKFYSEATTNEDPITMCFEKIQITSQNVMEKSLSITLQTRTKKFLEKVNGKSSSIKLNLGVYLKKTVLGATGEYITLARSNAFANAIIADYNDTSLVFPLNIYYTREEINTIYNLMVADELSARNSATSASASKISAEESATSALESKNIALASKAEAQTLYNESSAARTEIAQNLALSNQAVTNAQNSATSAESYKNSAQNYSNLAAGSATSAANSATTSEELKNLTLQYKNSAESSASSALTSKNSAELASQSAHTSHERAAYEAISARQSSQSALGYMNSASSSEANALNYKNQAETAVQNAQIKSNEASKYANSAKTYSEAAEVSKNTAQISASSAQAAVNTATQKATEAAASATSANEVKEWIQSNTQIVHVYSNANSDIIVDILNNNVTPLNFSIESSTGDLIIQG